MKENKRFSFGPKYTEFSMNTLDSDKQQRAFEISGDKHPSKKTALAEYKNGINQNVPLRKAVCLTGKKKSGKRKLLSCSVHKKTSNLRKKAKNRPVSPAPVPKNTSVGVEYSSPCQKKENKRKQKLLVNSCLHDRKPKDFNKISQMSNKAESTQFLHPSSQKRSPSFLPNKEELRLTRDRMENHHNFDIQFPITKAKDRLSVEPSFENDTYYAQSVKARGEIIGINSLVSTSTIHNTPHVSMKAKLSQTRESSVGQFSRNKRLCNIASIKDACTSVSSQRHRPQIKRNAPLQKESALVNEVYKSDTSPNKPRISPQISQRTFESGRHMPIHYRRRGPVKIGVNSANSSVFAKNSNNSSKDLSFEFIESDAVAKTTTANRKFPEPIRPTFYSKIKKFIFKDTTKFPCKCSEQDQELDCCSRAGKWVRLIEAKRNQRINQDRYLEEYKLVIDKIHRTEQEDPNISINTACVENFNNDQDQIEKDIERTLVDDKFFGKGKDGQNTLRELLNILARKDTTIGYVQGMNFLAAAFLYHCSKDITLFLLNYLLDDLELSKLYSACSNELMERNNSLKSLIYRCNRKVYNHFENIGLDPQTFALEWMFDLFSHTIPLNFYGKFLDNFLALPSTNSNTGWAYFDGVVVSILLEIRNEILEKDEWDEILVFIKDYTKDKNLSFFSWKINWDKILNQAVTI
ncbi:unnamed protein product [Moneuplotes crassus]|uniref:Rab-GAP TBC domain-containing protein n=1 Tax=Euplotes crassus TaxID=5936 RepID=A0AAD1X3T6_EUPCR|nr:unnamed protein product [Moneuplotes crassus]